MMHNTVQEYKIQGWHMHLYFNESTRSKAKLLRELVEQNFPMVSLGAWNETLVGPHPQWSTQIAFGPQQFADLVPFVAQHRQGLTVFLHGLSGNEIRDHTDLAIWMGTIAPLNMSALS